MFRISEDGESKVSPLNISNSTFTILEEHLLMFFTGFSRNASLVLDDQKVRSELGDAAMLDNLHYIKQLGQCIKQALEQRRRPALWRIDARALAAQKRSIARDHQRTHQPLV